MRVYSEYDLKLVVKTIMNALAKQACANRACPKWQAKVRLKAH